MKLKDFLSKKINSRNKQISLDVKKRKLKGCSINVDDILNMEIKMDKKKVKQNFEDDFESRWQ